MFKAASMACLVWVWGCGGLLMAASPSAPPSVTRAILSTVDGQVITQSDLDGRLQISLFGMGLADTPEVRQGLSSQMLDLMIDEKLQQKKVDEFKIETTEPEIQAAIAEYERQRGLGEGALKAFVKSKNLPEALLLNQFRIQIAWKEVIRGLFQGDVQARDVDVQHYISKIKATHDKDKREVFELYLPVFHDSDAARVREDAQKLVARIKAGASFQALAQEFSAGASSSLGGALGIVPKHTLSPPLEEALKTLKAGEVSDPIRTETGYLLLMYRHPAREVWRLMQAVIPLPPFKQEDPSFYFDLDWKMKTLNKLRSVNGCDKVQAALKKNFSDANVKFGEQVNPENLTKEIHALVSKTKVGHLSEPVPTADGIVVFGLCDRKTLTNRVPTPDEARAVLADQKFTLFAQRLMMELRDQATIVMGTQPSGQ